MSTLFEDDRPPREHCPTHPHYILPCVMCSKDAIQRGEKPRTERHRWVKPEIHHYVCAKCGIEKINREEDRNYWVQEYRFPDGSVRNSDKTPPCIPGKLTEARLKQYANVIADQVQPRKDRKKSDDDWEPPF